jgi:hypothetical protein
VPLEASEMQKAAEAAKGSEPRYHLRLQKWLGGVMGRLIFGMMQPLDGYIDGPAGDVQSGPPGPILFRHFTDYVRG